MTERETDSERNAGGVIDGVVELQSQNAVVSKAVTRLEDQIQVEITTELDDGTYDVTTFRFFVTREGDTVVPKHEVNREFRLIVASALRNAGYAPEM